MLSNFFYGLRASGIPVTVREYLTLLEALDKNVVDGEITAFYHVARAILVKNETNFDKYDQVFSHIFNGINKIPDTFFMKDGSVPEDWLRSMAERFFSPDEMAEIESQGGLDSLMQKLKQRLEEQKERHEGGNKWIGTGGTSPFGAAGYNPEGVRIGSAGKRRGRAVKIWEKREYRNLDEGRELGVRNLKVALRRLRKFAREGADEELDLDRTLNGTANKGYLDVVMRPERRNAIKVLAFFDVGGSMDQHILQAENLFSAARSEFKRLQYFYFHNCLYEQVWQDNRRRNTENLSMWEVLRTYNKDYKVLFVGDASMSPYEITNPGGSVEHWNEEAGSVWLTRARESWDSLVWLNPVPEEFWTYTPSIRYIQDIIGPDNMLPMTIDGITQAMKALVR